MEELYYIGLDLHKKIIVYCIKTMSGVTVSQGMVAATRSALSNGLKAYQSLGWRQWKQRCSPAGFMTF